MQVEIITIGDEILIGQIVDTNSAWMAEQLNLAGLTVVQITSISDTPEHIHAALREAEKRAGIILLTGGLGPTRDDVTKSALAVYFKDELILSEPVLKQVEEMFITRGLPMLEVNRKQALIPSRSKVLSNPLGTAPGMWMEERGKIVVSMPGVPYEMKGIMMDHVIPELKRRFKLPHRIHATVLTQGIGESFLAERIAHWEDSLANSGMKLAYLPRPGQVRLRVSATSNDGEKLKESVERKLKELETLIPEFVFGREIYGAGEYTLGNSIGDLIRKSRQTLSVAESCTGGFLAHLITEVSGSSEYFMGSVTAYANEAKMKFLGVSEDSLKQFGAVSEAVACEMASGAKKHFKTDYALSTTGVAGPGGGSELKPVGSVWIGIAGPKEVKAQKFQFGKDRLRNIERMSKAALEMLRKELLK